MKCTNCNKTISILGNHGSDAIPLCFECEENKRKNDPQGYLGNSKVTTTLNVVQKFEYIYLLLFTILSSLNTFLIVELKLYNGEDGSLAIAIPFYHIFLFWLINFILNQQVLQYDKNYIQKHYPGLFQWIWSGYRNSFRMLSFIAGERDNGTDKELQQAKSDFKGYIFLSFLPFLIVIWNLLLYWICTLNDILKNT